MTELVQSSWSRDLEDLEHMSQDGEDGGASSRHSDEHLKSLIRAGKWEELEHVLAKDTERQLRDYEYDGVYWWIPAPLTLLSRLWFLWTPLQFASMYDRTGRSTRLLLKYGCDPNAASTMQTTPLHLAVYYNHVDVVRVLLDHTVSVNVRDKYGKTPRTYARTREMRDLLQQATRRSHAEVEIGDMFQMIECVRSPHMSVTENDPAFHRVFSETDAAHEDALVPAGRQRRATLPAPPQHHTGNGNTNGNRRNTAHQQHNNGDGVQMHRSGSDASGLTRALGAVKRMMPHAACGGGGSDTLSEDEEEDCYAVAGRGRGGDGGMHDGKHGDYSHRNHHDDHQRQQQRHMPSYHHFQDRAKAQEAAACGGGGVHVHVSDGDVDHMHRAQTPPPPYEHVEHEKQQQQQATGQSGDGDDGGSDVMAERMASMAVLLEFSLIESTHIQLQKKIGHGGFGEVFKGVWRGSTEVAVKVLGQESHSSLHITNDKLVAEIKVLSTIDHPCLIHFHGAAFVEDHLWLCMEYATDGSLFTFLHCTNKPYSLASVTKWSLGVAEGMLYLHQHGLIHRDLKSPNVLLTRNAMTFSARHVSSRIPNHGHSFVLV
ncbi:TKL protein kinase [Salpingoeca rosetta]|uniref:TKL protein kinase n=1 Tax=Salpingoeca rosetta (strain ATCC 50818 / BSB-021) TaxID=946362 RepID=F2URW2_SALR5|nr:TKL protein kinase [Salpingoeca rosetta]EGD80367.1 TKL protein kinase [Salpingoeca rosetta]|eukprot:XP_004988157.1 TKL protein kinase [Salpingoeca rosetta]